MSRKGKRFQKLTSSQKGENPRARAGLFSYLSFSWLNELIQLGSVRPLEADDLYPLLPEHESQQLTETLEKAWQQECKRTNHSRPSLLKALLSMTSISECLLIMTLVFSRTACNLLLPVLVSLLLATLEEGIPEHNYLLYVYGLAISLCAFIASLLMQTYEYRASIIGVKIRAALTGLLFKKVLRLQPRSFDDKEQGNILNLVSNDINRFNSASYYLPSILLAPLEIVLASGILAWLVGWPTLLGVLTIPFFTLIQLQCAHGIARLREKSTLFADKRISLTIEVVRGIRVVKMSTWEQSYQHFILDARGKEQKILRKLNWIFGIFGTFTSVGRTLLALSILIPVLAFGYVLPTHKVFLVLCVVLIEGLATFHYLNRGVHLEAECKASITRIERFLSTRESVEDGTLKLQPKRSGYSKVFIDIKNVNCAYYSETQVLSDVTFYVRDDDFVAVCGPVGSGKSSLLLAILKELPIISGTCSTQGRIAYVPQIPWVFSGTIRENITFYNPLDPERLKTVIEACALENDIKSFPDGDLTLIGENGVVLSGGQRARVSLARAVYADADIYLLDDPLSAIDANVRLQIFEKCIVGVLKHRLRVLATHDLQHLQQACRVILLEEGCVTKQGNYNEVMHSAQMKSSLLEKSLFKPLVVYKGKVENFEQCFDAAEHLPSDVTSLVMPDEDRAFGLVSWRTYWGYISAVLPKPLVILLIFFVIIARVSLSAPDVWLSGWSNVTWDRPQDRLKVYIYIGLVCGCALLTYLSALLVLQTATTSNSSIHRKMVSSLLKAPVLFFDTNPAGRVLNRFSKDIGIMDELLPVSLYGTSSFVVEMVLSFIIPSVVSYWLTLAVIPLLAIAMYYGRRYVAVSREVARIQALNYSFVLTHCSNTEQGLVLIRTYSKQNEVIKELYRCQDNLTRAWFISLSLTRWLGVRMSAVAGAFITILLTCSLLVPNISAGLIGLAVLYSLNTLDNLDYLVRELAEFENMMTSVERAMAYTQLDVEPGYLQHSRPPEDWPREGKITFEKVSQVYYKGGPTVLKGVTFNVDSRQKVGIAGRTGAGKSSLVAALMRMPQPQGRIIIDGVDISQINLVSSRQVVSIIPQDPVLFSGSLRRNIDPLGRSNDTAIWQVLEDVHLKEKTQNLANHLDYELTEGGSNFSVGERQLICLARALLEGNKIIVLDEATANVDYKTDHLIQETIREKFQECTVLTIAHRVNTILDYDRVLVLDQGKVVEYDEPAILLGREDGWFTNLCKSTRQGQSNTADG